jgi:tetratricopeptide (TPR) repeat protein
MTEKQAHVEGGHRREEVGSVITNLERQLAEHPQFPDLHNQLGVALSMAGDPERGRREFKKAVDLNPDYVEAHLNLSVTLSELGRYEEAQAEFHRAAELEYGVGPEQGKGGTPKSFRTRIAHKHAEVGDLYREINRYAEAVREYEHALQVNPSFLDIRLKLGRVYLEMQLKEEAVSEFRKILETNPKYHEARAALGFALFCLGDRAQAEKEWRECLALDPENIQVKHYLTLVRKEP